ncbi:glycosyltransferase family 2 protein [Hypoxylon cercidicola]|nr:glycosyltransferase family 2 protein [Hypoxylon cercidicola]
MNPIIMDKVARGLSNVSMERLNGVIPDAADALKKRLDGFEKRSLVILLALYFWDYIDGRQARKYAQQYRPFPIPAEGQSRFGSNDVSIIVPTVNWDTDLPANLLTWLRCQPREVIFVTTAALQPKLINDFEATPDLKETMLERGINLRIFTVQKANKRSQLCRGINAATGRIVALVDDDAKWTTKDVLKSLLAPFQNDDVGLVGGPIESYIPQERQRSDVITGWEVAALRTRARRRGGNRAFFAADGSTNFTVSGLTMLLRTEIVQDPYFQFLFMHDMFQGVRQNTGDDGFITRYVLFQHLLPHIEYSNFPEGRAWKLGMQFDPRATVQTSLLASSRFADQSKRWFRSGLRLRLTCLLFEPGFSKFRQTAPYMSRKMMGGMLSPLFTYYRLYLWLMVWLLFPKIVLCLLLYVLYNYFFNLQAFYKEFPYVGKKIWAAVVADHLYFVTDIYSWLTLPLESWSNRSSPTASVVTQAPVAQAPVMGQVPTELNPVPFTSSTGVDLDGKIPYDKMAPQPLPTFNKWQF